MYLPLYLATVDLLVFQSIMGFEHDGVVSVIVPLDTQGDVWLTILIPNACTNFPILVGVDLIDAYRNLKVILLLHDNRPVRLL